MKTASKTPQVVLAGAGPGDPELITLKLQKRLQSADTIISDRLVHPLIIEQWANPNARILFAGKQGYNDASCTQEEVTELIISEAKEGNQVLRLKGGDTAFFSNVLDELEALVSHQLSFEIIPGITAASGASAYAGIPLTARNYAQGVQFLTFNPNSHYNPEKWKQLANTHDTLVFYMAAKNINGLVELLLRYSRTPHTPIAVVSQATTIYQEVHVSTLTRAAVDFSGLSFPSPSLVIIGEVVHLHENYNWFSASLSAGSVFRPLEMD